jgi:hypothetical protein
VASFVGMAINAIKNILPSWTNNQGLTSTDDVKSRADTLSGKFNSTTGHAHDGSSGNGVQISAANLANVSLMGFIVQGTSLTGATGGSTVVTTEMTGKIASAGSASLGVVVTAPYNKAPVRQGSGVNKGDKYVDGSGNEVYARITFSAGVWTLTYYVDLSGVETAYSFSGSNDVDWYYQQLYNPVNGSPVYDPGLFIPSDNATADVVDATDTQRGLVSTGAQNIGGDKTLFGSLFFDATLTRSIGSSLKKVLNFFVRNIIGSSPGLDIITEDGASGIPVGPISIKAGTYTTEDGYSYAGANLILEAGSTYDNDGFIGSNGGQLILRSGSSFGTSLGIGPAGNIVIQSGSGSPKGDVVIDANALVCIAGIPLRLTAPTLGGNTNLQSADFAGTQTYTFPIALPVTNGDLLSGTTAGVMSWVSPPVTGATTALDNLVSVAINADLIFGSAIDGLLKTLDETSTNNSTSMSVKTGDVVDGTSGNLSIKTGVATGTGQRGRVTVESDGIDLDPLTGNVTILGGKKLSLKSTGAGRSTFRCFVGQTLVVDYTLPNGDGNPGDGLTTNGSGVLSWTAPSGSITFGKQNFTLIAGDITVQYIDLSQVIKYKSLDFMLNGLIYNEDVDYTVNLNGGAGGKTRVTFAGDLASGGASPLAIGDVVYVKYNY